MAKKATSTAEVITDSANEPKFVMGHSSERESTILPVGSIFGEFDTGKRFRFTGDVNPWSEI